MPTPTPPRLDNESFLYELNRNTNDDERALISSVPGDPEQSGGEMWNVRPWRWGARMPPPTSNNYVCVSAFREGPDGWRRRASEFATALAFMVDDLGTKLPLRPIIDALAPTALIETSPGNFQAWYFLSERLEDYERFAALQAAFVARWSEAGKDPGMGGPNRVGRLPEGINGKRKYGGWSCRARVWAPERRFGVGALLSAFDLRLRPRVTARAPVSVTAEEQAARAEEFNYLVRAMERQGLFLKKAFGLNGRRPCLCPRWRDHTNQARTGTYLSAPSEANSWWGSFVCFHSSTHNDMCKLRELKDEVVMMEEQYAADVLARANAAAPEGMPT